MTDQPPLEGSPQDLRLAPAVGCALTFGVFILWNIGVLLVHFLFMLGKGSPDIIGLGLAEVMFLYTLAFSLLVWFALRERNPLATIGLKAEKLSLPRWTVGVIVGAGGIAIALGVIALTGDVSLIREAPKPEMHNPVGPFSWPAAILMFALFAGEEEIFARGLLYPMLKRSIGFTGGLLISSAAFTSLHLLNPQFAPLPALEIFLAGVLLCLLRELTGELYLAWGAHFGWNMAQAAAGLPVSGIPVELEPQGWHLAASGPDWLTGGTFGLEGGLGGILATALLIAVTGVLVARKHRQQAGQADGRNQ